MSVITQIVDRCHVSDSHRRVIRYVVSRLKRQYQTWRALSRSERRTLMQEIIATHDANRALYRVVMKGGR